MKIHYRNIYWGKWSYLTVCGVKKPILETTLNRSKVTCENCKRTDRYKRALSRLPL